MQLGTSRPLTLRQILLEEFGNFEITLLPIVVFEPVIAPARLDHIQFVVDAALP
jgi:hypothetical protein